MNNTNRTWRDSINGMLKARHPPHSQPLTSSPSHAASLREKSVNVQKECGGRDLKKSWFDAESPIDINITPVPRNIAIYPEPGGSNLVEAPIYASIVRIVSGRIDPFKPLPGHITSRMGPHIYYCIVYSSSWIMRNFADNNVLMPTLHPTYTTTLTRKTFSCNRLFARADEFNVTYTSAFAATSRAATNDNFRLSKIQGFQEEEYSRFDKGVYYWLYFKGRTINLVNERLQSMEIQEDIVNEVLLHAICNFILMEVCWPFGLLVQGRSVRLSCSQQLFTGNIREAQCHINDVCQIAPLWHQRKDQPMSYKVAATI